MRGMGTVSPRADALPGHAVPTPARLRSAWTAPLARRARAVVIEATEDANRCCDDLDDEFEVVARLPSHTGLATLMAVIADWRPTYLLLKAPLETFDYPLLAACMTGRLRVMVLARPEYGWLGPSSPHRFGGLPWLRLRWRHRYRKADVIKRFTDIGLVLLAAPILVPVLLAIAIPLSCGGTPLYMQKRVGRGGRCFKIIKLRTMRRDAEAACGPTLATSDDPRLTRIGRLLRRFRIDELPQMWNVLRGDMSLVGPRPERPEFTEEFRQLPGYELRHEIRPGLTGIAQLTGGYGASVADKLRCDLLYVSCRSWWLDAKLIALTAREFLRGFPRG